MPQHLPVRIVWCHNATGAWCADRPGRKSYEQSREISIYFIGDPTPAALYGNLVIESK